MRKNRFVSAVAAAIMFVSTAQGAAFSASAEGGAGDSYEEKVDKLGRYFAETILDTNYNYTVDDPELPAYAAMPRKFDLRDVDGKNYVTPVKNQRRTGNCWAYSAMACSETSILYEMGVDLNTCDESQILDLSERQIAWFVGTVLGAGSKYPSQEGEGGIRYASYLELQKDDPDYTIIFEDFFGGGYDQYVLSMLSTGQGPVDGNLVPNLDEVDLTGYVTIYEVVNDPAECEKLDEEHLCDKDKTEYIDFFTKQEFLDIISDETLLGRISFNKNDSTDWYVGNGRYWDRSVNEEESKHMDWSVDDAYRFSDYTIENIVLTQKLADSDPETSEYRFNENVLNTIKNELLGGRAVMLSMYYGTYGQSSVKRRINYIDKNGERTLSDRQAAYLCYYCFDDNYDPDDETSINKVVSANHAVTVVGYDDDFPKEYFYDPKGTIKGDGAFIIKNSWGCKDDYDYYGNNGDGFFYISYYDQSLGRAMSIDYKTDSPETKNSKKLTSSFEHLYDIMTAPCYGACNYDDAAAANVFICEHDQKLVSLGTLYSRPNNTVKYDVYILNEDSASPTDGTLAASLTVREPQAGYHNTDLEKPLYLKKGTLFSVVATVTREDGKNEVLFKNDGNEKFGMQTYENKRQAYIDAHGSDEGFVPYSIWFTRGVINPGESYVFSDGEWLDWSDVVEVMHTCGLKNTNAGTLEAGLTDYDNPSIHAYVENAYFSVEHKIAEPRDEAYNVGDEVVCTVSVTKELDEETGDCEVYVNGKLIGTIENLEAGETAEIEYIYTVTENDLERGYLENSVQIFTLTADGSYREFDLLEELNSTALTADVAEPEDSSESTPDSTPESEDESESTPDSTPESEEDSSSESSKEESGNPGSNPNTGTAAGAAVIASAAVVGMILSKKRTSAR